MDRNIVPIGTNLYQARGHANREAYLRALADDFGVSYDAVWALACLLGPEEDFDGLVTELEDMLLCGFDL
jgi:hypothetical protein